MGRPGQMLGNQRRLVAFNERTKAFEMGSIERLWTANRHTHSVQRNRMVATDTFERMMRRTAGAHVIFGMNLEKAIPPAFGEDGRQVLMLEARACKPRYRMGRKAEAPG